MKVSLERELQALEPFERQVLELVYFKDKTQKQIATMLSVPREKVSKAVATGMQKLGRAIESAPIGQVGRHRSSDNDDIPLGGRVPVAERNDTLNTA